MFSNAVWPVGGTSPIAVVPVVTASTGAGLAPSCARALASAINDGSSSMKIGTSLGSSARPASCFKRPMALSLVSALWYGRSVVTAS